MIRQDAELIDSSYKHVYSSLMRDKTLLVEDFDVFIEGRNVIISTEYYRMRVGMIPESLATLVRLGIVKLFSYKIEEDKLSLTFKKQ